ncbi:hypothetical protein ACVNPZ_05505 [Staphylococcus aureus]
MAWLGYGERAKMGLALNRLVRDGEISAPIVIKHHLDAGSVTGRRPVNRKYERW